MKLKEFLLSQPENLRTISGSDLKSIKDSLNKFVEFKNSTISIIENLILGEQEIIHTDKGIEFKQTCEPNIITYLIPDGFEFKKSHIELYSISLLNDKLTIRCVNNLVNE